MASGKTHDWVTMALLPSIWLISRWGFHLPIAECLLIVIGTFVGSFFLSPDLDIRSRPFYRWGILRFIWIPYQWAAKHRSTLSHGVWFASWLRLIYLSAVLIVLYAALAWYLSQTTGLRLPQPGPEVRQFWQRHHPDLIWLGVGIWVGCLLHILLDWLSSAVKSVKPFRSRKRRR